MPNDIYNPGSPKNHIKPQEHSPHAQRALNPEAIPMS